MPKYITEKFHLKKIIGKKILMKKIMAENKLMIMYHNNVFFE